MDNNDAKKVIEELSEKPFLLGENTIKTDSGYVVTTKSGMKDIRAEAVDDFLEQIKEHYNEKGCMPDILFLEEAAEQVKGW